MTEIPDDIKAVATRIATSCTSWEEARDTIAAALLAERKRCARIARTEGVYPELNVVDGGPEWYRHGQHIAAAIMEGDGK